uniref:glutathione transferase n=1 Tax=Plectus sambesii TaxID=2011161 RepID=A0A914WSG2_9BILA
MTHYKLTYFNIMGLAEPIRLMFAQAGVEYENVMISREEGDTTWAKLKPTTPYGTLPLLEVDGRVIAQSIAISNYLSKKFDMNGENEWEAVKAEELVQAMHDVRQPVRAWWKEKDERKKAELLKKLESDVVLPFFDRFEKILAENGTGFFVGSHITQADLHIFNMLEWWQNNQFFDDAFYNHPTISAFVKEIANMPNIKNWREKRPKTEV